MKTIYFVRHGESEHNRKKLFYGWTDSPLTELGVNQAAAAAMSLEADNDIEVVFSSDLIRAKKTGKIIAERNNLEFHTTKSLREINIGAWEGLSWEEIEDSEPELAKAWFKDYVNFTYPGGESAAEAAKRASTFIDGALKDYDTILVVGHSGTISALLSHYLFGTIEYMGVFKLKNARIQKIVSVGERYALELFNGE